MPHVVLRSPLSLGEIGRRFKPMRFGEGDTYINLMDSLLSLTGDRLMVEAYISEPPLKQRVALSIQSRESEVLVVSLSEIGFPRSTPGIQLAIGHLSDWMIGLDPDSQWLRSNLKDTDGSDSQQKGHV